MAEYPNVLIHTSGFDVGLPEGTMGNSEVGHQNIGAGRIVDQESVRIPSRSAMALFTTTSSSIRLSPALWRRGQACTCWGSSAMRGFTGSWSTSTAAWNCVGGAD